MTDFANNQYYTREWANLVSMETNAQLRERLEWYRDASHSLDTYTGPVTLYAGMRKRNDFIRGLLNARMMNGNHRHSTLNTALNNARNNLAHYKAMAF